LRRFKRDKVAENSRTRLHIENPYIAKQFPDDDKSWVCVPVKSGTLVLIHGSVIHKSSANSSSRSRFIYTFHTVEGRGGGVQYSVDNWLQMPAGKRWSYLYEDVPAERADVPLRPAMLPKLE
jgi:ectoine hydroxylase-related dioxygenase (phytanoyl-CoA dioxygenase family)